MKIKWGGNKVYLQISVELKQLWALNIMYKHIYSFSYNFLHSNSFCHGLVSLLKDLSTIILSCLIGLVHRSKQFGSISEHLTNFYMVSISAFLLAISTSLNLALLYLSLNLPILLKPWTVSQFQKLSSSS